MRKPMKPSEVAKAKQRKLPSAVIAVFDELIAESWHDGEAVVGQNEAVKRIAERLKIPRQEVFDRDLLDVEEVYRKAGWKVEYDKPGYCETYEATFTFTKGRKR
jgi:hypothetical protein